MTRGGVIWVLGIAVAAFLLSGVAVGYTVVKTGEESRTRVQQVQDSRQRAAEDACEHRNEQNRAIQLVAQHEGVLEVVRARVPIVKDCAAFARTSVLHGVSPSG